MTEDEKDIENIKQILLERPELVELMETAIDAHLTADQINLIVEVINRISGHDPEHKER